MKLSCFICMFYNYVIKHVVILETILIKNKELFLCLYKKSI